MEQSAVEWLVEQLFKTYNNTTEKKIDNKSIIEQAKEMEDENMINFLKSVFQMDGFDYKKALEQFKNK